VNDAEEEAKVACPIEEALRLALRMAEAEYEQRGPENDLNYDPKAGDVIANIQNALDSLAGGDFPAAQLAYDCGHRAGQAVAYSRFRSAIDRIQITDPNTRKGRS
jgi:hypothetical protein